MVPSNLHISFLVRLLLIAFSVTASIAEGTSCILPKTPASCQCSGTSLICSKWSKHLLNQVPAETTSLTITGTNNTKTLTSKNWAKKPLPNLRTLNLTDNTITDVQAGWFDRTKFPALEKLILDENNLTLTDPDVFTDVSNNLTVLSLDEALFWDQSYVVQNLAHAFNQTDFPNLKVLRLDNNNITLLFDFSGLVVNFPKLQNLTVHNSHLLAISEGIFSIETFPQLQYLDLSDNAIQNIDKKTVGDFDAFKSLSINLSGNPFFCNCMLADFKQWLSLNTTKVLDKEALICAGGYNGINTNVSILNTTSLPCAQGPEDVNIEDELRPSYIILAIILALVGVLALIVLYLRRNDIKDYFVGVYSTTKEAFNSHHGYDDINRVRRDTPEITPTEV